MSVVGVIMLAVMALLALGRPFMGTAVLLHEHRDLGAHTHEASTMAIAFGWARAATEHSGCDHDHEMPNPDDGSAGMSGCQITVISIDFGPNPPSQPSSAGGADAISKTLAALATWCVSLEPYQGPSPESPGGSRDHSALHLCRLSSGERLIATSRALLI